MFEKLAEVMPQWIEVKTVVSVKYIKMLDKDQDPNLIERIFAENFKSLRPKKSVES